MNITNKNNDQIALDRSRYLLNDDDVFHEKDNEICLLYIILNLCRISVIMDGNGHQSLTIFKYNNERMRKPVYLI